VKSQEKAMKVLGWGGAKKRKEQKRGPNVGVLGLLVGRHAGVSCAPEKKGGETNKRMVLGEKEKRKEKQARGRVDKTVVEW